MPHTLHSLQGMHHDWMGGHTCSCNMSNLHYHFLWHLHHFWWDAVLDHIHCQFSEFHLCQIGVWCIICSVHIQYVFSLFGLGNCRSLITRSWSLSTLICTPAHISQAHYLLVKHIRMHIGISSLLVHQVTY